MEPRNQKSKNKSELVEEKKKVENHSDGGKIGWIQWLCTLEEHEFLVEVGEDYICDPFNLYAGTTTPSKDSMKTCLRMIMSTTQPHEEDLLEEAKPHGIPTPRTENFRVNDTAFHKFDWNDAAALGTCSHCFPSFIKSTQNDLDCSQSQAGSDLLHHQQFRGGNSPVKRTTGHHLGLNQLFKPM